MWAYVGGMFLALTVVSVVSAWLHFLLGAGDFPIENLGLVLSNLSEAVLSLAIIPLDVLRQLLTRLRLSSAWSLALLALWFFVGYESNAMLQFIDRIYSTFQHYIWSGILADALHVANLVYSTLTPVSNSIFVLTQQLAYAAIDTVYRCDNDAWQTAQAVVGAPAVFVGELGASFVDFVGNQTAASNPLVNTLNTTKSYYALQEAAGGFVVLANCSCNPFTHTWQVLHREVLDPTVAAVASNLTYLPVCVLQRALLSQNFTACTRAALSAAHGLGYVADGAWRIALSLFGAEKSIPQPFVWGTLARLLQAPISFVGALANLLHAFNIFSGQSIGARLRDFADVTYLRDGFSQLYAFADGVTVSTAWFEIVATQQTFPTVIAVPACEPVLYETLTGAGTACSAHGFRASENRVGSVRRDGAMLCPNTHVNAHPHARGSVCVPRATCCLEHPTVQGVCLIQPHDASGRCYCAPHGYLDVLQNTCVRSAQGCSHEHGHERPCGFARETSPPPGCADNSVHDTPLACHVGALARAPVALAHATWRLTHAVVLLDTGIDVYKAWQAFDGQWQPRNEPGVESCEQRKNRAVDWLDTKSVTDVVDFSAWKQNFACNATAALPLAVLCDNDATCTYDPSGAAPTLQQFYAELDKVAYWMAAGQLLPETLGGIGSALMEHSVEAARVATRLIGLLVPYLESTDTLNQPINSKYGMTFKGPAPPGELDTLRQNSQKAFDLLPFKPFSVQGTSAQDFLNAVNGSCMFQAVYTDTNKTARFARFGYDPIVSKGGLVQTTYVTADSSMDSQVYGQSAKWCNSMAFEWLLWHAMKLSAVASNSLAMIQGPIGNTPGTLDTSVTENLCHSTDDNNVFLIAKRSAINYVFTCTPGNPKCDALNNDGIRLNGPTDETWCPVHGVLRTPCSLAALWRQGGVFATHLGRQAITNVMAYFALRPDALNIQLAGARCQLDQILGLTSSTLAQLIVGLTDSQVAVKAVSTVIFAGSQFLTFLVPQDQGSVFMGVKTSVALALRKFGLAKFLSARSLQASVVLQDLIDIIDGQDGEDIEQMAASLIASEIRLQGVNYFTVSDAAIVALQDDLNCCQATVEILKTFRHLAAILIGSVAEGIAEIVTYIIAIQIDWIAILGGAIAGPLGTGLPIGKAIKDMFEQTGKLFKLFYKNFNVPDMILGAAAIWEVTGKEVEIGGKMYKGPGSVIQSVMQGGCNKIGKVVFGTQAAVSEQMAFDKADEVGQEGDVDPLASSEKVAAAAEIGISVKMGQFLKKYGTKAVGFLANTLCMATEGYLGAKAVVSLDEIISGDGLPFRRRLLEVDTNSTMRDLVDKLDWHGESECALQHKAWDGRDDAKIAWCVQNRIRAAMLQPLIPVLPANIFDDWWQPVNFAHNGALAWFVYRTQGLQAVHAQGMSQKLALWVDSVSPIAALQRFGSEAHAIAKRLRQAPAPPAPAPAPPAQPTAPPVVRRLDEVTDDTTPLVPLDCSKPYCMECLMLTETLATIEKLGVLNAGFYNNEYATRIRPEFFTYWSKDADNRKRYMEASAGVVWQASGKSDGAVGKWVDQWAHASLDDVEDAFEQFFIAPPDKEVPLFDHGLWHYFDSVLRPCDADALFRPSRGTAYAIDASAAGVAAYFALHIFVPWLPLPLVWATGVGTYAYLSAAYDWSPRCLPALPALLVDDIMNFTYGTALPPCMCSLTPTLVSPDQCSKNCTPGVPSATYPKCPSRAFYYNFFFFLRWVGPQGFLEFRKYYDGDKDLAELVEQAVQHRAVAGGDIACFFATLPSFLLVVGGLVTLLSIVPSLLQRLLHAALKIFFAVFWLALGLAKDTAKGARDVAKAAREVGKPESALSLLSMHLKRE